MTLHLAALVLAAAPVEASAPAPALAPPQLAALRCGVVFAMGSKMQLARKPAAAAWPPLAIRGKEYFVRVFARLMDDTGASRDQLSALAGKEAAALEDDRTIVAAMPGCLGLLDAAGV